MLLTCSALGRKEKLCVMLLAFMEDKTTGHFSLCPFIYAQFDLDINLYPYTGGSHLGWIFWEHENLSGLSVLYTRKRKKQFWQKIWAKQESGFTAVWLKQTHLYMCVYIYIYGIYRWHWYMHVSMCVIGY